MSEQGYVYALINSSLSGMVKVGKTSRDPNERAQELSSATGVPTPFSVAYQIYVSDCSGAEAYIHTYLEELGYRVNENREFFNAPLHVVIEAMLKAEKHFRINSKEVVNDYDNFNDKDLAQQLYEQGEIYYEGKGENLQSYEKALTYFKKAAKLGSADALWRLGSMYFSGIGCKQDISIALEYYEKAAMAGRTDCWASLGSIYAYTGAPHGVQNISNARKCYNKFFQSEVFNNKQLKDLNAIHAAIYLRSIYTVKECLKEGTMLDKTAKDMPLEHIEKLKYLKEEIIDYIKSQIVSWEGHDQYMAKSWTLFLEYVENVID